VRARFELTELALENQALRTRLEELERRAAEAADKAGFLRAVLRAVPAFIVRTDCALVVRYSNLYQPGLGPEQVIGRSALDFIEPAFRGRALAVLTHTLRTGEPGEYETRGTGAYGQIANYQTRVTAFSEGGRIAGLCMACTEMTAHVRREQMLRDTETKLGVALEATGLGLWSWDAVSGELLWDDAMRQLHGDDAPATFDAYVQTCVHPEDRLELRARSRLAIARSRFDGLSYRIVRPDRQVRWVLASGRVIVGDDGRVVKITGGTLDISEHRVLEEQLRQAQKMEAIGNLTAGIAHNFNNMLSVIIPALDLCAAYVPRPHQALSRDASHASQRASELVQQLTTFAGRSPSEERSAHDVLEIVDGAVGICRRAFDRGLTLYTIYEAPPATVMCNAGQIEQVLVNLLLNSRDAVVERRAGGRVTIRVTSRDRHLLPPTALGDAPRACVCIEVADNGVGMSDETRRRAFEPFFTTKQSGRGTGLGLATSFAIVRDHQGSITCQSAPGEGTTFTVLLPLSRERCTSAETPGHQPLAKNVCALLVDDEAAVRSAVGHVLSDAGVRVLSAGNGAEALAHLAVEPDTDVVLLDRLMPEGPGEYLLPRMRELAPHARILFFSGEAIAPELVALADGVVPKPIQGRQLLDAIGRVLGGISALPH
jgi:two-component system, cell cycle sensor histidine kinase and response regulator CckA